MQRMDNAHALVVGIADYQHVRKLPRVKDAEEVARLLVDPAQCGYRPENVQFLLDQQATLPALRQGLGNLTRRCGRDSMVFIYFSGHGGRIASGPHAGEYLLPVDVDFPTDETLARTAFSGTEFTAALNALPAQKVVVIFDCCHAGGIGQPRDLTAAELRPGLSDSYYDALKSGRGRVIFASSRPGEFSYVLPGAEYGLFTEHLLAGLRGGVASEDGLVRIFDLFEYVQPRVTQGHSQQHPLFKAEVEENFAIALYRGGEKGVVARDEQGFRFDVYISYADREPDSSWVWGTLVPQLEQAGLRVAVSGDTGEPGVPRLVNAERGLAQAKRIVVVLSPAYLADHLADFEHTLGMTLSIEEGTYRLLPVKIAPVEPGQVPRRLAMLTALDLTHPSRAQREFARLLPALKGPLPRR